MENYKHEHEEPERTLKRGENYKPEHGEQGRIVNLNMENRGEL